MTRRFRTLLSTSILATAVLGMGVAPALSATDSTAEPEVYFYPASGWSVGQSGNMCAISSQFNNGFVMQFTGGEKWVQGLNINFRQDVFEAGKSYDVTLSVPGIQKEVIKAAAQGADKLDMSLRREKEFYQALRKAAVLDLSVEGNAFRFYLTGFSQKAVKFESCMAAVTGPNGDANYMVNEAIAMEEKIKTGQEAVVEIAEADPQPVVQEIPYKEVTKVDDVTVAEKSVPPVIVPPAEDLYDAPEDTSENGGILDTEVAEITPLPKDEPVPVMEMAETTEDAQAIGRKRLSQMLAEQIKEDPTLIDVEDQVKPESLSERRALAMPPNMDELAALPESDPVVTPEPVDEPLTEMVAAETAEESVVEEVREPEVITFEEPPVAPAPVAEAQETQILAESILAQEPTPVAETSAPAESPAPAQEELTPAPVDDAPMSAPPVDVEAAQEIEPAPAAPPAPEPKTIHREKSPPMKINRETSTARADFTNIEPAMGGAAQELRKQILELERTVETLKAENTALNNELGSALRESEEERLSIASENWNLESATMKYNEAERQISRLGQQLTREKAKCNAEKRDLEAMLFDPQVTNEAQLAQLASLEEKLKEAERELEAQRQRYEERIRILEGQNSTH